MKAMESEKGGAPTLAIFTIFVIVSSGLVMAHLRSMERGDISEIQQLMASDFTRATNASIEAELNDALSTAVPAAMDDVGRKGGDNEDVENLVINYLNNRIEENWDYPNLKVNIPQVAENSTENSAIKFNWQADGSVEVRAYLDSKIEHVKGPTAYGISIQGSSYSRFQRIKHVSEQVAEKAKGIPSSYIENFESELNDNYECERIKIELTQEGNIKDLYGGEVVIHSD